MTDVTGSPTTDRQRSHWAEALTFLALLIAVLSFIVSYSAHNRASEALEKANEQINSATGDGSGQKGLMNGTGQAPVLPPTQEDLDEF